MGTAAGTLMLRGRAWRSTGAGCWRGAFLRRRPLGLASALGTRMTCTEEAGLLLLCLRGGMPCLLVVPSARGLQECEWRPLMQLAQPGICVGHRLCQPSQVNTRAWRMSAPGLHI